ncbi:MAG TPA: bifunctional serine/threonine-protein kinase/formylglycine-generating enzyme family protein [Bryobacteraceae bacterium]|nr:bifunctional serine/threonine-protein kinase/formylglycine-generating enzyme family protein [Bryobacteraceae bacterium]
MQLPARIGKYELEEFLGGGMSHVYRARDTVIGRTVALKILTEAGCEDAEAKERFLAEARMAGNISHDNVLSIYDFGEDDQHHPFMVMEFLKGEDLRHAIKGNRTGGLRDKLKIAVQVAKALQYIHTQKIIHRDIKPENVNVSPTGVVKLMDFGIAKTEGLQMTRAGYVLGTPYYMSPEQVTGAQVTEQVDVYSFGVLLFELMTGTKPISGDTVERIFYSILHEPLNLEPMVQAGAPQALCDLVARCTMKNPAERPQGFGPVIAEIDRIGAELDAPTQLYKAPDQEPVVIVQEAAPHPKWLVPVVAAVVVLLAAGLYFAMKPKTLAPTIAAKSGEMELVPAGPFKFGKAKVDTPTGAYYIDKTEVSNQAYKKFCDATGHALPPDFPADKPDFPVVNVTIDDAEAFAKWAGERLPSAREWEKAARGTDGRDFPWGNDADPSKANVKSDGIRPVTDFASAAGPYHTQQMIGNVWELIEETTTPSDRSIAQFAHMQPPPTLNDVWHEARGGSYLYPLDPSLIWDETPIPQHWSYKDIGFRCVKDAPQR